jgi:Zn-dependent alcohol dehydrogenase
MKVRAAALLAAPGKYETIEVELEGPRQNEVLVWWPRLVAGTMEVNARQFPRLWR